MRLATMVTGKEELLSLAAESIPGAGARFGPIYRRPSKIWGIGLNYKVMSPPVFIVIRTTYFYIIEKTYMYTLFLDRRLFLVFYNCIHHSVGCLDIPGRQKALEGTVSGINFCCPAWRYNRQPHTPLRPVEL